MPDFEIIELGETDSTNRVAAKSGCPGQVYVADYQTAGRGRLDHRWIAPRGVNLAMSVVMSVENWTPGAVSVVPLLTGYAVLKAIAHFGEMRPLKDNRQIRVSVKWPNDILINGRKVCGILCERHDDNVIIGIGVNVLPREFPPELADRAVSLSDVFRDPPSVVEVRTEVLKQLAAVFDEMFEHGFVRIFWALKSVDELAGKIISVMQTDNDIFPICGMCEGIQFDGSLKVGGQSVYAGEAHILECRS